MWSKKLWVFGLLCLMSFSHGMHGSQMEMESKSKREIDEKSKVEAYTMTKAMAEDTFEVTEDAETKSKQAAEDHTLEVFRDIEARSRELEYSSHDDVMPRARSKISAPLVLSEKINDTLAKSVLDNCPPRVKQIRDIWKLKVAQYKVDKDLNAFNKRTPKKLLLVGPAGTGKSTIGKAIAADCGMPYFMYATPFIANEYITSGTQNIRKIFTDAAALKEPCVIIIDELETLLHQYSNKKNSHFDMLPALWTLVEEYKKKHPILFIATANSVSNAPAPIESRLGKHKVIIDLPTESQREQIISHYMETLKSGGNDFAEDVTAKTLAKKTHNFSPRDLEELIETALEKINEQSDSAQITMADCLKVIATIKDTDSRFSYKKTIAKAIKLTREWLLPITSSIALPIIFYVLSQKNNKEQIKLNKDHHAESMAAQIHTSALQKYQHNPAIEYMGEGSRQQRQTDIAWYTKETKLSIDKIKADLLSSSTT